MDIHLLPADTYIVKNNTIYNNEDNNILFKLYQPIIGSLSISLYLTLWSDLDSLKIMSTEFTHHSLMAKMRVKLEEILEAREKLEAIGLLKTYLKKDNINCYIYELYSPVEPKEFFDNPVLSASLESNVGKREYKKILKFFTVPNIKTDNYKEITSKFNDIFDINNLNYTDTTNIKKINQIDFLVNSNIDINKVIENVPEEYLNKKNITKEIKILISKLSFIYNLNEEDLVELIKNSVNEKNLIDKKILRENCKNYYSFENPDKSPSLIYKKQPEYLREKTTDGSKKSKLIYTFETTSPYDYLSGKNKGIKPSKHDLDILDILLLDYELNPGVVNVLIDYVLKINNNKLTKNYVLTIAQQWKRSNIKTVVEAMDICLKENKGKKQKTIKKEKKPEWYDKNIDQEIASDAEIALLEKKLSR